MQIKVSVQRKRGRVMDKLVEHAIRMLEIVEGENDFFRNDEKRQADIARAVYDTILRVQVLERKARKTDNSSEKPNNCDTCRFELYCPEMCEGCCEWDSHYEPKDEPQTCSFSDCDNFKNPDYERCIECKRKQIRLKTERTERSSE